MKADSIVPDHSLRSLARAEWLSFSGGPSEHMLLFVQAVHRFAFAHGRQKDDVWMADYAYGCLSGEVLEWFEDLDPDVKQDWSRLRQAMVTKFRQSKLVPTTSGAASGPHRVRVVRGDGTVLGYVSPPNPTAHITVVASADEALVLNLPKVCDGQEKAARIRIAASDSDVVAYPFLGLENWKDDHWIVRACEEGPKGSVFKERARADTHNVPQVASSNVWSIKKLDNSIEELCMHWMEDTGSRSGLKAMIPSASNSPIYLWMRKAPVGSEESVKLILERF
ncbi:hypothetical protein FRB95_010986 [Tulasnella sp. JGI-2019a]|nr:hypothetical protein FRB95_010986 [Tulasnella sp. JGI-2019a]